MKTNNHIISKTFKKLSIKFTTRITVLFIILGTFQSQAQLSHYLQNFNESQTFYDIKAGMTIYLDSLKANQDSATFYAEGGEYDTYRRFENYWEMRLYPHGDFTKAFNADSAFKSNASNYQYFSEETWHEVGPVDQSYGIGPVEYLSIFDDGTVESTRYMLVASLLSGVFYSTDYGETWSSTGTDTQWAKSGSGCAIFHPNNHEIWFASSSNNSNSGYSTSIGKTGGVYRTSNEGNTWVQIADHLDLGVWTAIYKLLINPFNPNVLFAVTSKGIYKTTNYYATDPFWTKVLDGLAYDMELKPGSNSTLYATVFVNEAWKVMISTNYGDLNSWDELSFQPMLIESSDLFLYHFTIEVSKAKPEYLYCSVKKYVEGGNPKHGAYLFYYDFDNPLYWISFSSRFEETHGMGHGFGVEQVNNGEDVIVSRKTRMRKFNINTVGIGDYVGSHHVDIEDILFHPYNTDEVWTCTHGGVENSINGGTSWTAKYNGLSVANVERMATSVTNPEYVMVGLYHDGTQITRTQYNESWIPDWQHIFVGDGMRPLIDPIEPNKMWASYQWGNWVYTDDYFDNDFHYQTLNSGFYSEGVFNKVMPSVIYRKGYLDPDDEDYEVYRTENGQNTVVSAFQPQFPLCLIWQLFTPYTNEDYLLISLRDTTDVWHLYRTTNANDQPQNVQWVDLPIPRNGWIASVDFDPENEDIVYLVYTNSINEDNIPYGNQMIYKIDYTNPASPVFTQLTNNLPITSTGSDCIEIDYSSNRGIYLYTEYGVFYTNNDLINAGFDCWLLYGKELPHTRAGSLEINYACNKIRAGLYGRGVWELPIPCLVDENNITVSTSATWSTDKRIGGTVTIEPNVELTIQNSTTYFAEDAKVIVKPSAKLILDNCQLKSACWKAWDGIEVWGYPNAHQYPDAYGNYQQGYLELKNDATIENAQYAVRLWDSDGWDNQGGIVQANGAVFRNNRKAIEFMEYQNFDPATGDPRPNQSYFHDCTFETTEAYDDIISYPFEAFVTAWKVDGIKFRGNTLIDYRNGFKTFANESMGIRTIDANFIVNPNGATGNRFEGLTYGIYASQLETNNTYRVDKSDFVNNQIGIYNTENNYAVCIRSDFLLGTKEPAPYSKVNVGLLNTYSTGFTYEQNEFGKSTGYPPDHELNYGIWNVITGTNTNLIYNNKFTSLHYANLATGLNRSYYNETDGLIYQCNKNYSNIWYDFMTDYGLGIAGYQGNRDKATGNTFSHNSTSDDSDFANYAELPVTYYYYDGDPDQEPINADWNFTPFSTTAEHTCPDHFPEGIDILLDDNKITALRTEYAENKEEYNNTTALFESLKDGGDTPGTILDIETSWPDETWELRAQLLAESPHLSEEVLMEAAIRTDVLPHTILFEICMANPEEMRNERFLEFLSTKEEPMPQYMIEDLRDGADEETYKSVLQNEMAMYKLLYTSASIQIIRNIVLDSIAINHDSLRVWLDKTGTLNAVYQIVDSYLAQDDYTNANQVMNDIPNNFELTAEQNKEYDFFYDLKTVLITAHQQNRNALQLDSTEVADLETIADSSNSIAGAQAQSLLNFAYGYNYFNFPIPAKPGEKSGKVKDFGSVDHNNQKENHVTAHPNPANQWVAFDYNLPYPAENATIVIRDVSGKTVTILRVNRSYGQTIWDTRGKTSGIYFYSLEVNGNIIDKRKLIITK